MRILQVITDPARRGAQLFAQDLHGGLERLGATVRTVALAPNAYGPSREVEVLGSSRRSLGTMIALRRAAHESDIAIAHGSTTLDLCALALVGAKRPFVYRQISDPRYWASSPARRIRVAGMIRRASAIVALSESSSRALQQHYSLAASRIDIIPNAVQACRFVPVSADERRRCRDRWGIPRGAPVIAVVAALVPEKGVDRVIRLLEVDDQLHVIAAGDGPEQAALTALGDRIGDGRAHLIGPVDDVRDVLGAADVLALASLGGDSMPAVLIEAGLMGIPSVVTDIGAVSDVVVSGSTGFVTRPENSAEFIEQAVRLVHDSGLRRDLGDNAQQHCRQFTIDEVAPHWMQVIERVLRTNTPV
jgi:glycosyltransferase involved in cell wall biosynthesis